MKKKAEILSKDIRYAILTRQKEVSKAYIILPKVFDYFGLSNYINIAQSRMIKEEEDKQFFIDHVKIDLNLNHYWLDAEALEHYKSLLMDFMDEEQYDEIVEMLRHGEERNNADNSILQQFQGLSLSKLKDDYMSYKQYSENYQEEAEFLREWCKLELLSRLPPIWLYWQIVKLIDKLRLQMQIKKFIKNRKEVEE
jgi:hypothetical protein